MNVVGKRESEPETMEKKEEPKINYRGWKVMPFIIGKHHKKLRMLLHI